jgi:hypothetical protein
MRPRGPRAAAVTRQVLGIGPGLHLHVAVDRATRCLPLVHRQKVGVELLEAAVGLAAGLAGHERAARYWGALNLRTAVEPAPAAISSTLARG